MEGIAPLGGVIPDGHKVPCRRHRLAELVHGSLTNIMFRRRQTETAMGMREQN